jgi:5-methylcytosine-specific restriction enzyme subunit McrC
MSSDDRRCHLLTEHVGSVLRLDLADVAFLQEHHPGRFQLTPTGRRGRIRLVSLGHVGVLDLPRCRLIVQPKIPLRNLLFLLDGDAWKAAPGEAEEADVHVLAEWLTSQLVLHLQRLTAAGLQTGYVERSEQGPFLHGRLDVAAHLRQGPEQKDRLHSQLSELTADLPCNRVLRGTAERLLNSRLLGAPAREQFRLILRDLARVQGGPVDVGELAALLDGPLRPDYRPALELCRWLLEGIGSPSGCDTASFPSFLLDMERVFERYLTRGLIESFAGRPGWRVTPQPARVVSRTAADSPELVMRPDVLIEGRRSMIVDAKWKRLPREHLITRDVYQMLAYCLGLGVERAVLVYPGRRDRLWPLALKESPVDLEVRTMRVQGTSVQCRRSLGRLAQALRCGA